MPRAIWKGSISFGLVTIPVSLMPAESPRELAFHMLDDRDMSRINNLRVNASTREEVPREHIVKGYEVDEGRWVTVTDGDLRAANVEATQSIDVLAAVCADEIAPEFFATPYHLVPEKPGRKAYALLRDTLADTKRVAIAKVVIRTRQHLAAIIPHGRELLLEILRYPYEIRDTTDLDLPEADSAGSGVTEAERKLASELVAAISRSFDPADPDYRDTYHDDVVEMIRTKADGGAVVVAAETPGTGAEVVDIVALLKSSLEEAKRARG